MKVLRFIAISLISFNAIAQEIKFPQSVSSIDKNIAVRNFSSNLLDLSKISGEGLFFQVRNPETGQINDIKDPIFIKKGRYYYYGNSRLLGYDMQEKLVSTGCKLVDIKIPEDYMPPKATDEMWISANLSSQSQFIEKEVPFDPSINETFTFTTSSTFYDDLGEQHVARFYFVHNDINVWIVHTLIDDFKVASGKLFFDTDGSYVRNEGMTTIEFSSNGKTNQSIKLDFSDSTQFAFPSGINSFVQNGYTEGYAAFDEVSPAGVLSMHYDNHLVVTYAKVAITG